ncbi:MAG: lysylphosphatidylglycerol synthetase family protein [Acetobacteraceae bacterium]|nr:lysylphosphatidylglycerol synthetase family protein [Acetobacteraceae bacterium]
MQTIKKHLRHLPALLGVVLLIGAIYVVQREFRNLRLDDISAALEGIPLRSLGLSLLFTVLSYGVLTFYDRLGTIYAGHRVSYGRVCFASFCAYALSHNLGFAAVSGAAVRYRLYAHWGGTPLQIAKTVAFCSLTFGLGGMVLGGAILFFEPQSIPFFGNHLPLWSMLAAGALLWAMVVGYVTLSRVLGSISLFGHRIELPGWRMAIVQVLLATADVAVTASIFYVLLPPAAGLSWMRFLGVYVASYSAGLAANLPGGIGVFDTAMLLGLSPWLDAPHIVGAIVVYRFCYYVIPLFLAGALFSGNELLLRRGTMLTSVQAIGRWSEPDFAVAAVTGSVALCGAMLLSLGMLAPTPDFSWIDPDLAEMAQQAGQFVPSLIGATLLVLAIGLSQRVNLAWGATMVMLMAGAAFTLAQGERFWIAGMLVLAMLLMAPFRGYFYRHARLLAGPLQPSTAVHLFALIVCVLALAAFERHVRFLADNSWWEIVLSPGVPNSVRLTVALTVALALVATWRLIRPGRVEWNPWNFETELRLADLGAPMPPTADGLVWGEAGLAAIPFRRCGRLLLALGDPVGPESDHISAVWRLRDLAHQEGRDPAVWRAGPGLLKIYGDLGLTALPLGPEGLPLPEAVDETPISNQYLVCVAERDLTALLPMLPSLAARSRAPADARARAAE